MSIVKMADESPTCVYVILGIDENAFDQVLAVRLTYTEAKRFCIECTAVTEFHDLWIEKHPVM